MCYNDLMKILEVIKVNNLNNLMLEQIENSSNTLFITSTRSLNYQSNKDKSLNVIDFTQLQSFIREQAKQKDCMLDSEMRYLLYKTIADLPNGDPCKLAYKNSLSQIYDLFDKLLISNITADKINLKQIKKTQLQSISKLFELYSDYLNKLNKQAKAIYQTTFKECLREYLSQYDNVSLVGFTFFNDIQNAMFNILIENNKLSSIISNDDFIVDDFIIPLLKENKVEYKIVKLDNTKTSKFDSLRENLFTTEKVEQSIADDLQFYKPFFTREMEFSFIISNIQSKLKEFSTKEQIVNECEKLAIIITSNFAKQTQIFNDILKRQGVFIAPNNKIFYSQDEFLKSNYDKKQSKEQRLKTFESFTRLEMYEPPKTLFNSVLGRFVCEIYKISGNGMKLANFNTLLQINWLFKNTQINDIISEFNVIKDFFENLQDISSWKNQILNLIDIKKNVVLDKELHNHPLNAIRLDSLEFIKRYILFIDNITNRLNDVSGNVKKHIKTLIEAIKNEVDDELIEKELLAEFEEILNSKDNNIEIDNEYFAKNFQNLINEYLTSKKEKTNNIRINAINLESANCYDTVYLPMFEENKYPMAFKYEFPYTQSIVEVLSDNSLIKDYKLPLNKTLDYNIKLSKYVFENLFRIAQENIVFTRIDSENGSPLDMSIFGYDIKSKFDNIKEIDITQQQKIDRKLYNPIVYKELKVKDSYINELLAYVVCPKMYYYMTKFEDKNCYTDKFLLNFYCKALIVNKTFTSLANGSIYTDISLKQALNKAIDKSADEIFNLLPLFDENNKNDILLSTRKQIHIFVDDTIFKAKFKPKKEFTLTLSDEKVIEHNGVEIKTYKTLVVKDLIKDNINEFDISKSLDCLISSTNGKQTTLEHFWEIVDEINSRFPKIDRAFTYSKLCFKLNTQLNSQKFNKDGIERTKKVVDWVNEHDCSNYNMKKSGYCSYCKYKNICMGGVDND